LLDSLLQECCSIPEILGSSCPNILGIDGAGTGIELERGTETGKETGIETEIETGIEKTTEIEKGKGAKKETVPETRTGGGVIRETRAGTGAKTGTGAEIGTEMAVTGVGVERDTGT